MTTDITKLKALAEAGDLYMDHFGELYTAPAFSKQRTERGSLLALITRLEAAEKRCADLEEFRLKIIEQFPNQDLSHEKFRIHVMGHAEALAPTPPGGV